MFMPQQRLRDVRTIEDDNTVRNGYKQTATKVVAARMTVSAAGYSSKPHRACPERLSHVNQVRMSHFGG